MIDWPGLISLFATGAISGMLGGMLGIGGAIVLVPVLSLAFGLPIHLAIGVSLLNNVAVSTTATLRYQKLGMLNKRIVFLMNAGSIAGILIGTYLATRSPEAALKVLFGAFLVAMALNAFFKRGVATSGDLADPDTREKAGLTALGFTMGLLGALLGMGGGSIAVPALNTIFGMRLKHAVANSLATIVVSSSLGAVIYFLLGSGVLFSAGGALLTAVMIVPGSIAGARAGAVVSERLHADHIRYIFYAVLLFIAYNMIKSGLGW